MTRKLSSSEVIKYNLENAKVASHSWSVGHWTEQAKGCKNRKVDRRKLKKMPWMRGTCGVCLNFKGETHIHRDSGFVKVAKHELCLNERR